MAYVCKIVVMRKLCVIFFWNTLYIYQTKRCWCC